MGEGKIRNNIRMLRFMSGELTQQELAEKAGITRGICSLVGCADEELALGLVKASDFLVHGLLDINGSSPSPVVFESNGSSPAAGVDAWAAGAETRARARGCSPVGHRRRRGLF